MRIKLSSVIAITAIALLIAGCGRTSNTPSQEDIRSYIIGALPPFLQVTSVETEAIGNGQYNFKATAKPREPLYIVVNDSPFPELTLLSEVQGVDGTLSTYGRFHAEKTVDRWTFSGITINSGLEQLGAPRGSFPAGTLVTGSAEAKAALASAEQRKAQQARIAAEKLEEEKREALALAEKQKREAEEHAAKVVAEGKAYRARLLEAMKVGQLYVGVLTRGDSDRQAIEMCVLEQSGFLITVEFRNPDEPGQRVRWKGAINFKHTPDKAPIQLSAIDRSKDGWGFYSETAAGELSLRFDEDGGIDGNGARYGYRYSLKLQLQVKTSATPSGNVR